jgi:hypothetical protein
VHEITGRLRHEDNATEHDSREDERRAKHISPAARLHIDKDRGHNVTEDFPKCNHELVQRDKVSSILARDRLRDVDRDGASLETNAKAENDPASNHHTKADGSSFKGRADSVETQGDDNGHPTTNCLIERAEDQRSTHSTQRDSRANQADLLGGKI